MNAGLSGAINSLYRSTSKQTGGAYVRSPGKVENKLCGFAFAVPSGDYVMLGDDLESYPIDIDMVIAKNVHSGDYIESKIDRGEVREITNVGHIHFDNATCVRPCVPTKIDKINFMCGQRVMINTKHPQNILDYFAKSHLTVKNEYKAALLINGDFGDIKYLCDNGIDAAFSTRPNYDICKALTIILYTVLLCKKHAYNGENVILFINNLNKMFKLYNYSTVKESNTSFFDIDGCRELRNICCTNRQIKDGGSLSIITHFYDCAADNERTFIEDLIHSGNVYFTI